MKVNKCLFKYIVIGLILLLLSMVYLFNFSNGFISASRFGLFSIFICAVLLIKYQKKFISKINLFFCTFCLFQFGLPILYSIIPEYSNYYINLFSQEVLLNGAIYSCLSIIVATLGILIGLNIGKNDRKKSDKKSWNAIFNSHKKIVASAALVLFCITSFVVLPVTMYAAVQNLSGGYGIAFRNVMSENGMLRFCQEFFYSSGLLVICFEENKMKRKFTIVLYCLASIIMMTLGDRSQGLVALFIFFYLVYEERERENKYRHMLQYPILVIGVYILSYVAVYIANFRNGIAISNFGIGDILTNVVSEMGFNFTSICFVMELVPASFSFKGGMTYLGAIVKIIPSTFDFIGIVNNPLFESGEMWLYNYNKQYRSFLNFGVGFSINAESFLNFSWFGLLAVFVISIVVAYLLEKPNDGNWNKYFGFVLLLDLLLFPRRQFATLVKSIEYSIFFMGVYLLLMIRLFKRK